MRGKRGQNHCVRTGGADKNNSQNSRIPRQRQAEAEETKIKSQPQKGLILPKKGKKRISKINISSFSPEKSAHRVTRKKNSGSKRGNSSTLEKAQKSREKRNAKITIPNLQSTDQHGTNSILLENLSNKENLIQESPSHTHLISRNESQASSSTFSSSPVRSTSSKQNNSTPFSFSRSPNDQKNHSPSCGEFSTRLVASAQDQEKVENPNKKIN
jgi:hypothetical protein